MIYKFEKERSCMEVQLINDDPSISEYVEFSIDDDNDITTVTLNKKDIYHLIGALHLLQKEMK